MYKQVIEIEPVLTKEKITIVLDLPEYEKPITSKVATSNMYQYPGTIFSIEGDKATVKISDRHFVAGKLYDNLKIGDECFLCEHLRLAEPENKETLAYMDYFVTKLPKLVGNENFIKLTFKKIDLYIDQYDGTFRIIEKDA